MWIYLIFFSTLKVMKYWSKFQFLKKYISRREIDNIMHFYMYLLLLPNMPRKNKQAFTFLIAWIITISNFQNFKTRHFWELLTQKEKWFSYAMSQENDLCMSINCNSHSRLPIDSWVIKTWNTRNNSHSRSKKKI